MLHNNYCKLGTEAHSSVRQREGYSSGYPSGRGFLASVFALRTTFLMALTMGSFWFPVAWADIDSDGDGMPDSFENQYLGEVMFEDHFDDGILDPAWDMKRTYWEEVDGKLKTVPEVLPGFNYGHSGNGRGPLIVLHEGDATWTDYSYEFTSSSVGVVSELNPHGMRIGWHGAILTFFRVQEQPASWNEPANYLYGLRFQVADQNSNAELGDWNFGGEHGTYMPGTGCCPPIEGNRYTFTNGNSPAINSGSEPNHVNVLVKGNKMYAWVNGVFLGEAEDPLNISSYGGISLQAHWEAMAWYDDVIVRAVGLNPNMPDAHLDYDDDGFTNLEEYQNNTNPMVPESGDCEHATYSPTDKEVSFDTVAMELYNPWDDQPNGKFALFAGAGGTTLVLKSLAGFGDFKFPRNLELEYTGKVIDVPENCYATYSAANKTLDFGVKIPWVTVLPDGSIIEGPMDCYDVNMKQSTTQPELFRLTSATPIDCE